LRLEFLTVLELTNQKPKHTNSFVSSAQDKFTASFRDQYD
jgi:hypothetical protein